MHKRATPLRVAIAASGMTITEVAAASGIERTKLSRIVNGLIADAADQTALSAVLDRPVEALFPSHEAAA